MKEKTLENKLDYIPDPFVTLKDKLTVLTEVAADHSTVQIPNLYITACPGSQIEDKIKNLVIQFLRYEPYLKQIGYIK